MKTAYKLLALSALLALIIISCQKETSFEAGVKSDGVLESDITGTCMGITVSGVYKKDTTLNNSNNVDVSVIVNTPGSYTITTDTINGYYFRGTGTFTTTGSQIVNLQGIGKPIATGTNNFMVQYDSTICEFAVMVVAGSGGSSVFTFNGSPGNCTGAVVNGAYAVAVALSSSNTVVLNVNVTTAGTWSLSTSPVNGITFSGSGAFSATGPQTITLTGSGTPTAAGTFNIPVTIGTNTCTFTVVCNAADYFPRTLYSNWSYQFDNDANDSTYIFVTPNTYPTGGKTYNIFFWTYDANLGYDTSGYYRRSGGDYLEWYDLGSYFGLDNPVWVENSFLKDDQAVNYTWTSPEISGNYTDTSTNTVYQLSFRTKYKILAKNTSVTVLGVAYPNTITVEERYELKDATTGNWVDLSSQVGYYKNYYSLGIGLINWFYDDPDPNYPDVNYNLRRYKVY